MTWQSIVNEVLLLWKTVWWFLKELGIKPPYDPTIPLLGIYHEETKIGKDTYIPLFTAALFTIAGTWKQPRCPLTDEQIKKLWYIYTMECCSAIERKAFESVLMRWMNLEHIMQSDVSQKEKDKYYIHYNIILYYITHISHHFMANRWGKGRNSDRLYFWGLQNHCRWWLQPWN